MTRATATQTAKPCPCGAPQYRNCCQPLHDGEPASSAEALMRSRYSAFVLGLVDYLRLSWNPSTRPKTLELEPNVRWLGLRIVEHVQMDADHAEVEFIARYRSGGGAATRLHERSRFVRHLEGWRYVDGQQRE